MDKKEAIQFLEKDRIKNVSIINFMEENRVTSIEKIGDSLLLCGKSDNYWIFISCDNEIEFVEVLKKLDGNDKFFASLEDWMLPPLLKNREAEWKLSAIRLFLTDEIQFPKTETDIRPLTFEDAEYIYQFSDYQEFTTIEYITERIQKGKATAGIYQDGKLVAWGLTHDDGAMGFLHVLKEYRRRGFGRDITIYLIEKLRKIGKIPFVQIEEKNRKSMNLAKKMGFIEDRRIHWLKIL